MFSARRTEADYQAWRDQRDWTAEKYRRFDRGEGMPPGLEAVGRMSTRKNQRFGEPTALPGGGKLFTLKHAIAWLAKEIPQSEHRMKEVQTWRGNLRLGWPSHARRWLA